MITLFGMTVFAIWFFLSAESVKKSGIKWALIGLSYYISAGFTLLVVTDKLLLHSETISEAFSNEIEKLLLQLLCMGVIFLSGFFIQSRFIAAPGKTE